MTSAPVVDERTLEILFECLLFFLTESNVLVDLSPNIAIELLGFRGWRLHLLSEVLAELRLSLPVETQEETGPPVADAELTAPASESENFPLKTASL